MLIVSVVKKEERKKYTKAGARDRFSFSRNSKKGLRLSVILCFRKKKKKHQSVKAQAF